MIFFWFAKQDEWKPAFRLTKRYLVYGWSTKSASVETNKQKNQHSEVAGTRMWWTRGGSNQAQGRKKEEHMGRFKLFLYRGINIVHNFHTCVTLFACTCNVWSPVLNIRTHQNSQLSTPKTILQGCSK